MATADTIKQYYVNILQRDPTATESSYWVATVDSGALTLTQVRDSLASGSEATTYVDQIIRIYQAAFGRKPDVTGINGWTDELRADATALSKIAAGFVNSTEWKNRYGDNTVNDAVLQALYQNVLGRTGSAQEITAWKATGQSMTQILIGFSNSAEFAAKAAPSILALKQAAAGVATADLATIYTGSGALFDPSTGSGQSYTLTIGEDNRVGTAGNDVFSAPVIQGNGGALASTLETIDTLDGGAGTDTLNATVQNASAAVLKNIENVNARFVAAVALDLDNATGVNSVTVASSSAAGTVGGLGAIANITVKDQAKDVSFDDSTATTLNLTLSSFGTSAAANNVDLAATVAAKVTTLNATLNNANATIDSTVADAFTALVVDATGANSLSLVDSGNDVKTVTVKGAGSLDVTGTALTGALTSFDASANTGGVKADIRSTAAADVKGGSGADVIDMDTAVIANSTVALGAGNDKLYAGALVNNFKTVDGGEGTDIINLTNGATLTAGTAAKISNFEVLDVSGGTGTYDISLEGFTKVQIDEAISGALAGAITLNNAGAGFALDVMSKAKTNANFALGAAQTIALKDDTGSSDAVSINVTINDGNNDGAVDGNVTFSGSTTIAGVESITVNSTVGTLDTDVKANAYSTTFTDLIAANVKTLTLTGNSDIVFTALTNAGNTLTKVDAGAATGDVTLNASAITTTVAYTGSQGVDTYTATNGGSIYAGKGNDAITLTAAGAGGKADTVIYKAASDVSMTDTDANSKIDAFTIETITNFVTGTAAVANTEEADVFDITSFGFTGYARSAVNKGGLAAPVEGGNFATSITDFFADAAGDRGVAFGTNGGATYVFVDANKDGNFTAADDIVIKLAGVTDFAATDVAF